MTNPKTPAERKAEAFAVECFEACQMLELTLMQKGYR